MCLKTKADFDKCLKDAGQKTVCIDFTATWCPPCKMIGPKYEAMVPEFPHVVMKKCDVDANKETAQACKVACMPTFQFFKNGVEVVEDKIEGANEGKIRDALAKHNKSVSFLGDGTSLGEQVKAVGGTVDTAATGGKPVVDENKPKTVIQFRFHNGQRATLDVNLDHKVSDLHTYIATVAPVDGSYQLINGFPPKPLNDPNATIEAAGLVKASITQKLC